MSVALWARGTRSMRMSEMSRRMALVVSSTRKANRNVQMGSTMFQRGSSCRLKPHKAPSSLHFLHYIPCLHARLHAKSVCARYSARRRSCACLIQMTAPAMATPRLWTRSPITWSTAPCKLMFLAASPGRQVSIDCREECKPQELHASFQVIRSTVWKSADVQSV